MYNALAARPNTTAVVEGIAASAASVVAMGAERIVMRRGATMMVHNPWTFAVGDASVMAKAAADLEKLAGTSAEIYAARTGAGASEMLEVMAAETLMTGAEAVEAGFADEADEKPRAKVVELARSVVNKRASIPNGLRAALMAMAKADEQAEKVAPAADEPEADEAPAPEAETGPLPPAADPEPAPAPAVPEPKPEPPAEPQISAAYAREVVAICMRAGLPQEMVDGFLDRGDPIDAVRAKALDVLCSAQAAQAVDNKRPVEAKSQDPHNWVAALKNAGAYAN